MHIVPPGSTGRRRAVLIGINYTGQQGQLSGCHNGTCASGLRKYQTTQKLQIFDSGCSTVLTLMILLRRCS
jgi:hypothetical protein